MNATQTEIFLWIVLGIPAIIGIIYGIYIIIYFWYYTTAEALKEIERRKEIKKKKEKKKMTIQEIISNLVKNRWSYGDIAKQAGVSKATISRWHKGTVKANKTLEEIVEKNLRDYVDRDKFDDQAGTLSYSFPTWDEVEKRIFTDDYYEKAISYHKRVIEALEKSRNAKKWQFTEDEKAILRNLPKEYNWLVRSEDNCLFVFTSEPQKTDYYWETINKGKYSYCKEIPMFNHLFKCIQWSNKQPCEFRKFI